METNFCVALEKSVTILSFSVLSLTIAIMWFSTIKRKDVMDVRGLYKTRRSRCQRMRLKFLLSTTEKICRFTLQSYSIMFKDFQFLWGSMLTPLPGTVSSFGTYGT